MIKKDLKFIALLLLITVSSFSAALVLRVFVLALTNLNKSDAAAQPVAEMVDTVPSYHIRTQSGFPDYRTYGGIIRDTNGDLIFTNRSMSPVTYHGAYAIEGPIK